MIGRRAAAAGIETKLARPIQRIYRDHAKSA
jgi:hypothetical protein